MKKIKDALMTLLAIIVLFTITAGLTWVIIVGAVMLSALCFGISITLLQATGIWILIALLVTIIIFIGKCFE